MHPLPVPGALARTRAFLGGSAGRLRSIAHKAAPAPALLPHNEHSKASDVSI